MAGTSKNDARDILSLGPHQSIRGQQSNSDQSNPNSKSKNSKKASKASSAAARATELGISRELYALLGDNAPSLSLNPNNLSNPLLGKNKNFKPKFKRKPTKAKKWKEIGFKNPARNDDLVLRHWNLAKLPSSNTERKNTEVAEGEAGPSGETQKDKEGGQEPVEEEEEIEQDYRFAQFNTTSGIYSYSSDEYNAHLRDDDWTQAETDYLMDLCTSYDLRFVVIHDRYDWPGGKPRSIEDLKSRYYAICRRLIRSRISAEDLESRQALVNTYLFDPKREIERKKGVLRLFERTPQQLAEEEALYVEAKRMEQNEARFASERESLLRLLGGWESLPNAMMDGVARAGSGLNIGLGPSGSGNAGEEEGRSRRKRHTEESASQSATSGAAPILSTKQKNELKQASFDLEHCIQRFDPTLTIPSKPLYPHLIGIPSSYPPTLSSSMDGPTPNTNVNLNSNASHGAYFRSGRILTTRPHLLTRTNETLSELIPPVGPKLVFPTARNIEKWEGLLGAVTSGLEMKKALDRVESELRVAQARYDSLLEQQKEKEKDKRDKEGQDGKEAQGESNGSDKGKQREKTQEELRIEKSMESMIQARDKDNDRDRVDREVEKSLVESMEKEQEKEKEKEQRGEDIEANANSNKRPRSESLVEEQGGDDPKRARREE